MLFRTKICGLVSEHDAQVVASAGADAIGLNFYPGSKRFVSIDKAKAICRRLPDSVVRVGVFVNAKSSEIKLATDECELDYVQLHGDEPPEFLAQLGNTKIIRAFRVKSELAPAVGYLAACTRVPEAVLLDAYCPSAFGGTGQQLPWTRLRDASSQLRGLPVILAGGLTPLNVGEAIHEAQPWAVDTASGVEKKQLIGKDAALVQAFLTAAKSAFDV